MVRPNYRCGRPINVTQTTTPSGNHFEQVLDIIRDTEDGGLLSDRRAEGLSGISGLKTVGVLQRLARLFAGERNACYLEIGVFQGLTLVSTALEAPRLPCFGIDNFATLDPEGKNQSIVRERLERFGATNAILIDADFEDALEGLDGHLGGRKIAVYFVDGPHDYRSQMVCLLAALRHLHDRAVIVIDDANYPDVRWSTRDFLLGHPEFKLLFDAYSPAHPANMTAEEKETHESGWLNGVQVLVRDPDGALPDMIPPTDPAERTLYRNEWLAHRLRLAELAPEALTLADAVCTGGEEAEARESLKSRYESLGGRVAERAPDRNTHSAGLTPGRFNDPPD
jgi:predicted O-methyltransferase YrrM